MFKPFTSSGGRWRDLELNNTFWLDIIVALPVGETPVDSLSFPNKVVSSNVPTQFHDTQHYFIYIDCSGRSNPEKYSENSE